MNDRRTSPLRVALRAGLCLGVWVALCLSTGCRNHSNSSSGAKPGGSVANSPRELVLESSAYSATTHEYPTTTLATSRQPTGTPGAPIELVAYVYHADSEAPIDAGHVTFIAESVPVEGAGPVEEMIATMGLANGSAEVTWTPSLVFAGIYTIRASYSGTAAAAPSSWGFALPIETPNDAVAMDYSMARLNHIVNLMSSNSSVASDDKEGLARPLTAAIADEFGLELLESHYRLESDNNGSLIIKGDAESYFKTGGLSPFKFLNGNDRLCVRTTFIVAANDDALVVVIKGTDGPPNEAVNAEGSPGEETRGSSRFLFGSNRSVATHPGWAWMASTIARGFQPSGCGNSNQATQPHFPGLNALIEDHRYNQFGEARALYLTGHSLGGALVRHLALALAQAGLSMPGDRVYTYGAPRQGAYNHLPNLDLKDFEFVAGQIYREQGIVFRAFEGDRDAIPRLPEDETRAAWRGSALIGLENLLQDILQAIEDKACGVVNTVTGWFGDDNVCGSYTFNITRPIGFKPALRNLIVFPSKTHERRYADGEAVVVRCPATFLTDGVGCVSETRASECLATDFVCEILFHTTTVGDGFDRIERSAHWVGDYEAYNKERLRGDPLTPNFYFPPGRGGEVRSPIDIVKLP